MRQRGVVFETVDQIPLESFTTFGVNVKPNATNPFGYFGTGLKYAIAVCLREGCEVTLWRGNVEYVFYAKRADFRGKDFDFVRMRRARRNLAGGLGFKYEALPFTLELGKNWELWQAFRELETNTRDEGGRTYLLEPHHDFQPLSHGTTILVTGSKFVDEFMEMDRHFLVDGKTVREDEAVQVIDRPSKHVYYRGVRIMDLKEEAEFTYNILSTVDLTEDRTAKHPFLIEALIAGYIVESKDDDFVRRATLTQRWEGRGLSYTYAYATPSPSFARYAPQAANPTAVRYWNEKDPTVQATVTIQLVIPKPDISPNELKDICAAVSEVLAIDQFTARNTATDEEIKYDANEPSLEVV